MKKFLQTAIGVALGSAHTFDWGRAIFVGIVCGIGAALWPDKNKNENGGTGRP
jgi:hypothetical protein